LPASAVANPITATKHPCNRAALNSYVDLPFNTQFDQTGRERPAISGATHRFGSNLTDAERPAWDLEGLRPPAVISAVMNGR